MVPIVKGLAVCQPCADFRYAPISKRWFRQLNSLEEVFAFAAGKTTNGTYGAEIPKHWPSSPDFDDPNIRHQQVEFTDGTALIAFGGYEMAHYDSDSDWPTLEFFALEKEP